MSEVIKNGTRRLNLKKSGVFGGWTSFGHPSISEMLTAVGLDFIGIDMEHSTINQDQTQRIIAAVQAGGAACLPRVGSKNAETIRKVLDSGADGVIVPMVSTAAEVEFIIECSKYPPIGKRGYGVSRAQGYGFDYESYTSDWNERSIIMIQIESIQGVEAADKLVTYKEIDGVMIGPYDISGSLGIPGQLDHPRVQEACTHVIEVCRRYQKACGNQLVEPTEETIRIAFQAGYTFVVLASDLFVLWKWGTRMKSIVQRYRQERIL